MRDVSAGARLPTGQLVQHLDSSGCDPSREDLVAGCALVQLLVLPRGHCLALTLEACDNLAYLRRKLQYEASPVLDSAQANRVNRPHRGVGVAGGFLDCCVAFQGGILRRGGVLMPAGAPSRSRCRRRTKRGSRMSLSPKRQRRVKSVSSPKPE